MPQRASIDKSQKTVVFLRLITVRDCSKDTGLLSSCPRLMQGMKGLLTPFALGFSPHVECDACLDLLLGAYTVNAFLHLAITPITPLHRIGG